MVESYYQKHKDERLKYQKKYYQKHKDDMAKYQRKHKEEIRKYQQERRIKRPYKKQGDFLKDKLKEIGRNQSWLARELGVSRQDVSNYVRGVYFPKEIEKRKKLCGILGIKYSDLEKILNED